MHADEIANLADRFFAAIEQGDIAQLRTLYANDATIWHNYDQLDQPAADNLVVLTGLHERVRALRYTDIRRTLLADGFVQQHLLVGDAPGGRLEMPAMLRVFTADGRVTRIEEYLDTRQAAVLRG
jgi:uncharacterized protein